MPITQGFVDAGQFTFAGRYSNCAYGWLLCMQILLAVLKRHDVTCRSWAGLKDHAQYWIIMGCLGGSGKTRYAATAPACTACIGVASAIRCTHQSAACATGLLVLLISGRLTLSNVSPLALTLSNTYGMSIHSMSILLLLHCSAHVSFAASCLV